MQTWIIFALIAMLGITFFNLSLQWGLNLKIAQEKLLFYAFAGCFLAFAILDWPNYGNLIASGRIWSLAGWGVLIAVLSTAANYLTVMSYKLAPNPGYVEGIKSSNGVFTSLIGLFLFSAPIYWVKWLGILIIPFGLWFFKDETAAKGKNKWVVISLLSALMIALMFSVWGYMSAKLGFTTVDILVSLFFFASLMFLAIGIYQKTAWKYPWLSLAPISLAILFGVAGNWFNIAAIQSYGTPGPPVSIYNTQAVITVLIAGLIFPKGHGGELNWKRLVAVGIIFTGALLIILSPK